MTPREHFADLDAFVAHDMEQTERMEQFTQQFNGVFKSITFVQPEPPRDPRTIREEMHQSKLSDPEWYNLDAYDMPEDMDKWLEQKGTRGCKGQGKGPYFYVAADSLRRTQLGILSRFLESGKQRMMMFEDDAYPRPGFLDTELDMPEDAHILAWGGAIPSTSADGREYVAGNKYKISKIRTKLINKGPSMFCTHAYEVDRLGAQWLVDCWSKASIIDQSWHKALLTNNGTYRVRPQGIVQINNESTIDASVAPGRYMPLERDEWPERKGFFGTIWHKGDELRK